MAKGGRQSKVSVIVKQSLYEVEKVPLQLKLFPRERARQIESSLLPPRLPRVNDNGPCAACRIHRLPGRCDSASAEAADGCLQQDMVSVLQEGE